MTKQDVKNYIEFCSNKYRSCPHGCQPGSPNCQYNVENYKCRPLKTTKEHTKCIK